MYYNIFSTQDSWILTGSSPIDSETFSDINNGQDQILELKKYFYNETFDYQSRVLINFAGTDFTNLSQSLANKEITGSVKYYLKLYEADGSEQLTTEYKLSALPISESWDEGRGKFGDNPKITDGVSWDNKDNHIGASANTWVTKGTTTITSSNTSQSFSYESPDVNMDITDMVNLWLSGSQYPYNKSISPKNISNYGLLLRFSGSQETNSTTFGQLKFFSRNTNTIYSPRLQVRWDDSKFNSGNSLTSLDVTGSVDNYIYPMSFRESYKEDEKVKFRFGTRKRYIQKSFSTSVQRISGSYIPKGSGSYSIVDKATGESVVPFDDDYTKLSCDSTSNYFTQWLNGFESDRAYKILIKIKYNDGQEQIFDNDFEFIVRR
jgi:hypothetical protein